MFCELQASVFFGTLEHKRPELSNTKEYTRTKTTYQTPNGPTVVVSCPPDRDVRNLTFRVQDYRPLHNFYLNNVGKLFTYRNHYDKTCQAVFTEGLTIRELEDECLYEIKVTLRCFP